MPPARAALSGVEVIEVAETAEELRSSDDVLVVGGGAGLSGALVLVRARRSVAVIDAARPRNAAAAGASVTAQINAGLVAEETRAAVAVRCAQN